MVKGISKRVVVIKSPDKQIFDEAIFIVREDASAGITSDELVKEAQAVADSCIQANIKKSFLQKIPPLIAAAAGGCIVAGIWAASAFLI